MAAALVAAGRARQYRETRPLMRAVCLLLSLAAGLTNAADTGASGCNAQAALRISQAAIGREVGQHALTRSSGELVDLGELRGKPLLISLIFTSCYHTCPLLTKQLAAAVAVARHALGPGSFNVATIGFDSAVDTPAMMADFRSRQGVELDNWYFLSADARVIEQISEETGFIFFASPRGFDHLSQTTLIDERGRVFDQIYGIPSPTMVVEPLKSLLLEHRRYPTNLAEVLQTVKLFCTVYDPTTGRYRLDYSLIVTILVGSLSLGAVAIFVVRAWKESAPPRAG